MEKLLEISHLKKHFIIKGEKAGHNRLRAVEDVSFDIYKGETLGLVGESGSGKTTAGRTLLRLYEPTGGSIIYDGKDITKVPIQPYRRKMQYIFQDPYASLNPRMTVGDIVGEPIDIHRLCSSKAERSERIEHLLEQVGLNSEQATRYPHEFSGGQRQRIGIARALAVEPEFIVCDEPVSALDVSIQAQIINMLEKLQQDMGLTYLFIAHDLAVVKHISQRIGVMYLGHIVELAETKELHAHPLHPYTRALLSAIPAFDPEVNKARRRIILEGEIPNPMTPPKGCVFSTRCPYAKEICQQEVPALNDLSCGHQVACHFAGEI
jgi:oligopeptide transport system ATP-binding protein